MPSRREFLGTSLAAGASLALTPPLDAALGGPELVEGPELLRAFEQPGGKLLQRAIPSSGEMLPVISFAPRPTAPPAPGPIPPMPTDLPAAKEVLKIFLDNGGKVVDVLHGGPIGEQAARTAATELGIQDKFFWTTPLQTSGPGAPGKPPAQLDPAAVKAALEEKLAAFKKIDLVMVGAGADSTQIAALTEMKKAGRIRYIGVHELLFPANAPNPPWPPTSRLEALMRNEQIDFIGTDYHVGDRRLEETILPLALERKIGVLAYFAFDRGRLFKRVGTTPLPEWAAEFDAKTWAQFFLKYVLSQPAVILARTGTTKPAHMLDNIGGGIGRLPDAAMRKRMAALVDSFPPNPAPGTQPQAPQGPTVTLSAAVLDRYVGEYASAKGFTVVIRRDGDKLIVKPGTNPEAPLIARSETRFQDPRGPFFEFEVDAQGKVTGAFLEQQGPQGLTKTMLVRK